MLVTAPTDRVDVTHRVLISASWLCCVLVLASFTLFVRDQLVEGSKHQQQALVASAPGATPAPAHHQAAQPRRFIDGAAHTITSPFDAIVASDSPWVNHAMPAVFGLLVYGLGLGYLARFANGRA
jgi:hypothetical protein